METVNNREADKVEAVKKVVAGSSSLGLSHGDEQCAFFGQHVSSGRVVTDSTIRKPKTLLQSALCVQTLAFCRMFS